MPNFDCGHYFLTVLAPIRNGARIDETGEAESWRELLRQELAFMPTVESSASSLGLANDLEKMGGNSPFAGCRRTHFARLAVIDDVIYNGRDPQDALLVAARGIDPTVGQPVDRLNASYLLFAVDFDAKSGDGAELDSYLEGLWQVMGDWLKRIFAACIGAEGVTDAKGFAAYIRRCQVETTMPFNDYWTTRPPLTDMALKPVLIGAGLSAAAGLGGLALWLVHLAGPWAVRLALIGILLCGLLLWLTYRAVLKRAAKPLPGAPNSDLRSVLKAIYLQQRFADFAASSQALDAKALHAAFGGFLVSHKPDRIDAPTQAPGVILS